MSINKAKDTVVAQTKNETHNAEMCHAASLS